MAERNCVKTAIRWRPVTERSEIIDKKIIDNVKIIHKNNNDLIESVF